MRHIVLFYGQGADAPFWKIRTPAVSKEQIDTEVLMGAAQPRCAPGMLVVVDGELGGVVESVARLGGSNRFRIVLRREISQDETALIAALEKLALLLGIGDGEPAADVDDEPAADVDGEPAADVDGEPTADEGGEPAADVDDEPAADVDGEPAADVDGEPAADVDGEPAADEGDGAVQTSKAPVKRKRKPKSRDGEQ